MPLTLKDKDSFFSGNLSVDRRFVRLAVKFCVVRLALFEDVVDGSQQHLFLTAAKNSRIVQLISQLS